MKAFGYRQPGPITAPESLIEFETATPELGPRDLLVEVKGISINPVDVKVRQAWAAEQGPRILGYDASGVVTAIGAEVESYQIGDEVFYAGDITRPGTNSEFHAVDERIVGLKPRSLDFAEAAALPLTSITAWEMLFDAFRLSEGGHTGEALLVIGGAGGVGSILIQLARQLTGLTVIATASRPETIAWTEKMGAHHVINHRESLVDQLKTLDLAPRFVASLTATDQHFPAILELIQPRGHVALIDDPENLDIKAGKLKALTFSWEFMFTRSMFQTEDLVAQQQLLNRVADMIDQGKLKSTMTQHLGPLNLENLNRGHTLQESGKAIGKNVLGGVQ